MHEIIAKLHRQIETIAARRKPSLLLLVMLCVATATMVAQPGAFLITIFLAGATVLLVASLTVDAPKFFADPTIGESANGMLFSVLFYFAAGDFIRTASNSTTTPLLSEVAKISLIQSYGIAVFIISSACAVTALVSRQLDWTKN